MILEKESKIVVLSLWMEIVGLLRHLEEQEDELLAEIGSQRVALPMELKEALSARLGSRIAILRTDIPGKEYLVRDLLAKGDREARSKQPYSLRASRPNFKLIQTEEMI